MLTSPNEIVPLQIARGARAAAVAVLRSACAAAVPDLRAVRCAIPNIKGISIDAGSPWDWGWLHCVRAVGGLASRPVGGRLPRHLECAAQGIGEPAFAGNEGDGVGNRPLAAAGRGGLARNRPTRAPTGGLVSPAGLSGARHPLLSHALHPPRAPPSFAGPTP